MKLIDADRLVRDINDLPYGIRGMVETIIYNQPILTGDTVDIAWLFGWIIKNGVYEKDSIGWFYDMMEEWRKVNEID